LRQRRDPLQAEAVAMKTATWAGSIGVPSASAAPHSAISARTQKGPDNSRSSVDRTLIRSKQLIPDSAYRLDGVGFKTMIQPRP
jgi:hypothetical protein